MKQNCISIVVVVFNIPTELPRTLLSLATPYQQGVTTNDYEVIVVDNGSSPAVSESLIREYGPNFRVLRIDDASPSPAAAVNRGIREAKGDKIGVMIDGARIVTPGFVRFAGIGLDMAPTAVVAAPGWYLGSDIQANAPTNGYTKAIEDSLLQSIRWPEDGYRLFEVGTMDESSIDPWFSPLAEANALFLNRENWHAINGMDERFNHPGGGLVNLDTLERAMALPQAQLILTLGEATFHQLHGGISTNAPLEQQSKNWAIWKAERDALRGAGDFIFHIPSAFVGSLPPALVPHLARAMIATPHGVGPAVAAGLRAQLKPPEEPVPTHPAAAALVGVAKAQFEIGNYNAAADIVRMASSHAPAELAGSRLLASAGILSRRSPDRDAAYFTAIGDAHRVVGENETAEVQYRNALAQAANSTGAHIGLASMRMSGPFYYDWLERLYAELKPAVVVEIGVYDGVSLSKVKAPTLAIGIDPNPRATVALSAQTHIFPETSDAFFDRGGAGALLAGRPVGVGFIDGLHTFDQVLRDFANLERYCDAGSVLLVHDTAALDEATQKVPPTTQFHTGDVWKLVPALKAMRPELDVFTIATPWTGLTVISGFGSGGYDRSWIIEAGRRFANMEFAEIEANFGEALCLVANEWEPVFARLKANLGGKGRGQPQSKFLQPADCEAEEATMGGFLHQYFLNNSGKEIYKWLHYFDIYERHFERFRNRKPVVVEVGVYKGGSLEMWRAYFGEGARIVGIDIDPACKVHESEQVEVFIGSQDDPELLDRIVEKYGPIDIVVDDGSHMMDHVIATFEHLYQHVQPNGVYLVEDTHTSYWDAYGGGLRRPGSFMEFAKGKLDEINAHHSRGALPANAFTNSTDSICVYDSIVVFEKRPQGKRQTLITGRE
ncbi:glycosyltransferase [Mesorhizobium sp. B2-3-11]|uniref:class I SAM-dependent methyltransferase n=1 Tax=Mesorhizobium sp. B2-3-11 TaxID=2589953 RepID=UPI001128D0EA|nr:class I SAM-dependent methyltransferase [Mesorhizobium sp. B2-3-11]TPM05943.1 glycosyltransferase [Mesorhizobium sp. B2-3-11]